MNNHFTASISLAVEANGTNQYLFDLIFICRSQQSDHVHYHPAEREFNRRFISISVTIAVFFYSSSFRWKMCVSCDIDIWSTKSPNEKEICKSQVFLFPFKFIYKQHACGPSFTGHWSTMSHISAHTNTVRKRTSFSVFSSFFIVQNEEFNFRFADSAPHAREHIHSFRIFHIF